MICCKPKTHKTEKKKKRKEKNAKTNTVQARKGARQKRLPIYVAVFFVLDPEHLHCFLPVFLFSFSFFYNFGKKVGIRESQKGGMIMPLFILPIL
jgi:hypothetical protein